MRFFDLHCDTLDLCLKQGRGFINNGFHIDLEKAKYIDTYIQCTAAFISDKLKGNQAKDKCKNMLDLLENESVIRDKNELENVKKGQFFIPTIENCSALAGDISNISILKKYNVKMATLTWNGDNEIGSGVGGSGNGLSDFGRILLDEFEKEKVIPDISHSSAKLFWDVCDYTSQKLVASHSCAKRLCSHKRNLEDLQILEIIKRKGLIGINFYKNFLNNKPEKASIDDIIAHCDYMLSLGGENSLAMGSDFDGCDLPKDMAGIESIGEIYNKFLQKNYSEKLCDKIFFTNAYKFFINTY